MTLQQKRQVWIVVVAVGLFVASIVYAPALVLITEPFPDPPKTYYVRVYGFFWNITHARFDYGSLVLTWLAIAAVAALGLYLNTVIPPSTNLPRQ